MILKKWEDLPEEFKNSEVKVYYDILSKKKFSLLLKRIFDIVVSFTMLAIALPFNTPNILSLVVCGFGDTIATFSPTITFNKVDFPAFAFPTTATVPLFIIFLSLFRLICSLLKRAFQFYLLLPYGRNQTNEVDRGK